MADPPNLRDQFKAACVAIASEFAPAGFDYLRSRTTARRRRDGWTESLVMQTATYNHVGYVALMVWVLAENDRVRAWREDRRDNATGLVFHASLGYLGDAESHTEWNVAQRARARSVAEITRRIQHDALPLFDSLGDFDVLVPRPWLALMDPNDVGDLLAANDLQRHLPPYLTLLRDGFSGPGRIRRGGSQFWGVLNGFLDDWSDTRQSHRAWELARSLRDIGLGSLDDREIARLASAP